MFISLRVTSRDDPGTNRRGRSRRVVTAIAVRTAHRPPGHDQDAVITEITEPLLSPVASCSRIRILDKKGALLVGEAKKRIESVRKAFLAEIDEWSFPPSEWEARTVSEIQLLPIVKVRRYPDDALSYMRMPARHCHANAQFMEDTDPSGRMKHITGWWIQGDTYLLHSVVLHDDQYVCVTPAPLESEETFDFVPDSEIEWRDDGEVRSAYRGGALIGKGVRTNPARSLAEIDKIRQRLLSGMNPYEAVKR